VAALGSTAFGPFAAARARRRPSSSTALRPGSSEHRPVRQRQVRSRRLQRALEEAARCGLSTGFTRWAGRAVLQQVEDHLGDLRVADMPIFTARTFSSRSSACAHSLISPAATGSTLHRARGLHGDGGRHAERLRSRGPPASASARSPRRRSDPTARQRTPGTLAIYALAQSPARGRARGAQVRPAIRVPLHTDGKLPRSSMPRRWCRAHTPPPAPCPRPLPPGGGSN